MDTGNGRFEMVKEENEDKLKEAMKALEDKYPEHGGWFREGQTVELNGSLFRIKSVKPTQITLKLLARKPI